MSIVMKTERHQPLPKMGSLWTDNLTPYPYKVNQITRAWIGCLVAGATINVTVKQFNAQFTPLVIDL